MIPLLSAEDAARRIAAARTPWQSAYYAMYSSVLGGIVTDPAWMLVPVDDHLVHRGDGVFETLKALNGRIYGYDAHLARLARSSAALGLALPGGETGVREAIVATLEAGGKPDALVRVLVARGPGGFNVNPYESPAPALYIVAYRLPPPFMVSHPNGAKTGVSRVPAKPPPVAVIKTCNYIPNALMKKEAVDRGLDFVFGLDDRGYLAESATENLALVTRDGWLLAPQQRQILAGTTLDKMLGFARGLVDEGVLRGVEHRDLLPADAELAVEILIAGTTANVTAVTEFEGLPVGEGRPGPVHARLSALLDADLVRVCGKVG